MRVRPGEEAVSVCGTTVTLRVDAPKTFAFDHVYAGGTQAAVYEDLGASARGESPGPRAGRAPGGRTRGPLFLALYSTAQTAVAGARGSECNEFCPLFSGPI